MLTFYVLSGPDIGKSFQLDDGALIGRSPSCAGSVRGMGVSREHARVERSGGQWSLVDLESRNGVSCDGIRVSRIELRDGLQFELGALELRVRVKDSPEPATPVRAPERKQSMVEPPQLELDPPVEDEIDLSGEIEFEGEEFFEEPPARSPVPDSSSPKRRPAPERQAPPSTAMRGSSGSSSGVEIRDGGRPVLQYSKQAPAGGFFASDLAQYPLWIRILAGLLAILLFGVLFFFAFRGSEALKQRAVGDPVLEEEL